MLKLIFLFFVILIIDLAYVILLDIKFGKALPISFITFFFIALISNLFGNLSFYKLTIPLFLVVSIIIILSRQTQMPSIKTIINKYFSISFFLFTIIYFYLYFLYKNIGLNNIDDLFHWSLSVDTIVKSSTLFPIDWYINSYPPFITWYISMICYILGGYSESFCLFALSNFCLSFIFPFIDKYSFNKKNLAPFFLATFSLILSYLSINVVESDQSVFVFNSIYIDWIMAILFAYLSFLVYDYSGKINESIYFSLILTALVLTKQVSIPLSLICIFSLMIKQFIKKNYNISRLIILLLLPTISYICWSLLLKNANHFSALNQSFSVVSNASIVLSEDFSKNFQIIKDFIEALFLRPIIFHPFKLSYFFFITIIFLILLLYGTINKKEKDYYSTTLITYLGSFGYAIVMLISYIVVFPDGYSLPLFSRYMQTYTFAYLLLCVYLIIDSNKIKDMFFLFLTLILLLEPMSVNTILINKEDRFFKSKERDRINQYVSDIYNNEKTAIISQTDMKYKNAIMFIFYDNKKGNNISFIQINNKYNSIDELKNTLSQYEYILIADHDTLLSNYWSQLTDIPLYNSTIYKITSSNNEMNIQLIEIFEDTN